jgi:MOSC domain-containing protein YiiM
MRDKGVVEALLVATERRGGVLALPAVQLKAGAGIVGDRYFGRSRAQPGRNLSLVEAEAIEAVAALLGLAIPPAAPRRNVVTRGVRLNDLVGREFHIGPVRLRGIELCEPCIVLGRNLETPQCPRERIVRAFAGRGGLRAQVLGDGVIRVGDALGVGTP